MKKLFLNIAFCSGLFSMQQEEKITLQELQLDESNYSFESILAEVTRLEIIINEHCDQQKVSHGETDLTSFSQACKLVLAITSYMRVKQTVAHYDSDVAPEFLYSHSSNQAVMAQLKKLQTQFSNKLKTDPSYSLCKKDVDGFISIRTRHDLAQVCPWLVAPIGIMLMTFYYLSAH